MWYLVLWAHPRTYVLLWWPTLSVTIRNMRPILPRSLVWVNLMFGGNFKRGENTPTSISSQFLKAYFFVIFWESLQFEATMIQLHTFHMDLHPPTHVQNSIFRIYWVWVSCNFSDQSGIICTEKSTKTRTCLGYDAPNPQRWQMSSNHCGAVPL